jgi:hypothetical protein
MDHLTQLTSCHSIFKLVISGIAWQYDYPSFFVPVKVKTNERQKNDQYHFFIYLTPQFLIFQ